MGNAMNVTELATTAKKRTNLSLNETLLQEAKALKINISSAADKGISAAIKEHKKALWLKNNAQAIESSNDFVNKKGLPLAAYRYF